jgi:hypothetical protein
MGYAAVGGPNQVLGSLELSWSGKVPQSGTFWFGTAGAFNYLLPGWSFQVKRLAHVIMSE